MSNCLDLMVTTTYLLHAPIAPIPEKNSVCEITDGNVILQVTSTILLPGEPLLSHALKRRKSQCVTEDGWGWC